MVIEQTDILYFFAIIIQIGIVVYFIRRIIIARKSKPTEVADAMISDYERTRNTAMAVTPQQLDLTIPNSLTKVYGVVLDWDMAGTVLTLSTFITGAANVALSSGAAVTGGGKNPAVAELAADLVTSAQEYLNRTVPVSGTGFPPPGTVKFYLLTNKGTFAAQELISSIENDSSPWIPLFFKANMVIEQIKNGDA